MFIFLDRSALNEKILQADIEMNQLMKQRVIELKAKLRSDCPTTQAITDTLRRALPNGESSLLFIATKLNTSERTLR